MTKPLSSRGEALDAATVDLLTDLAAEESSKKPRRRKKEKKKKAAKAPPLPREAPSAPVALPWADSDDSDEEETPLAPQQPPVEADDVAQDWRDNLSVGDVIDAKDSEGRWFDSRIVAIEGDRVLVHNNGWTSRWEYWCDRRDESIQPLFTHTDDWRRLLVGDVLEIRGPGEKALWYKGFVKEVDGSRVLVSSHTPNVDKQWLETSSEHICKLGTHVRDKPFARSRVRDASESEEVPNPPRDPRNVAAAVESPFTRTLHAESSESSPFVLVGDEKNPRVSFTGDNVEEIHAAVLAQAEAGDATAQQQLGVVYHRGVPEAGIEPDHVAAAHWFSKAAEAGLASAQCNFGLLHLLGHGVPTDDRIAAHWLVQAAEAGVAPAQNHYGRLLQEGRGVPKDLTLAVQYFQKAADQGEPDAMVNLGGACLLGRGCAKDEAKARSLLTVAASMGDKDAAQILSLLTQDAAAAAPDETNAEVAAAEESRRRTDEFLFSTGVAGAAADKLRSLAPDHQVRLMGRLKISIAAGASAADLEVLIMRADDQQYAATTSELAALHPSLRPVADNLALTSAAVSRLASLDPPEQEDLAYRFAEPGLLDDIVDLDDFIARAFARENPFESLLRANESFMEPDLVNYIQGLAFDLSRSCVKELRALDEQKQRGVAATLATVDLRDIDDPSAYVLECLDLSKRLDEDAAELKKKEAAAERAAAELLREEDAAAAARAKKKSKKKKKRRGAATAAAEPDEEKVEVAPAAEENKVEEEDQASLDLARRLMLEDALPPPPPPGKILVDEETYDDTAARAAALETSLTAHQAELRRLKGLLMERGVPDGLICPLSLEIYEDPVMAADGFSYERREIENWFARGKRTSPKTNEELPHTFLMPNRDLKSTCQDFLDEVRKFAEM